MSKSDDLFFDNNFILCPLELWAVVNNAGKLIAHEVIDGNSIDEIRNVMQTNTFGAVRVTKAFVSLLKETPNSRVVLVSSMASHEVLPLLAGYSMSKYAMRAFGNGLRRELKRFNIHVSMVEPTVYA